MSEDVEWNKFRLRCTNGDEHFVIQSENDPVPTQCIDGHALTADPIIVESRSSKLITINEEGIKTGGHFRIDCQRIIATGPTGSTFIHDFTEKISYNILDIQLVPETHNEGDYFDVEIAPDTPVGVLTANSGATGATLHVSSTVTANVHVGFHIKLFDGMNLHDCGEVLSVNKIAGTITVDVPPTMNFVAGTVLLLTVYMAKNFAMPPVGRYPLGTSKIGGSYVQANRIVRLVYHKASSNPSEFYVIREWLY